MVWGMLAAVHGFGFEIEMRGEMRCEKFKGREVWPGLNLASGTRNPRTIAESR